MNNNTVRWAVSLGMIASATIPMLFAPLLPACLSSSNNPDGGGSGSSSSGGSSGGSGSGMDSGGSDGPVSCIGPGLEDQSCVIDDMTAIPNAYMGYWYSFSDRTTPFGTDIVPGAAGTVSPPEGAQYPPSPDPTSTMGGPGPLLGGMPAAFREFSGAGLVLWGAGMGFDFQDAVPPDASAGPDGGYALGTPGPFDGSAHNGIAFYGKSNNGMAQSVGIHLADNREAAGGNVCDAALPFTVFEGGADINKNPLECGADFLKNENFTTSWAYFHITWANFGSTQTYSGTTYMKVDPTKLFYLHFQVNNTAYKGTGPVAAEAPWDISVAYVTWYDGM